MTAPSCSFCGQSPLLIMRGPDGVAICFACAKVTCEVLSEARREKLLDTAVRIVRDRDRCGLLGKFPWLTWPPIGLGLGKLTPGYLKRVKRTFALIGGAG